MILLSLVIALLYMLLCLTYMSSLTDKALSGDSESQYLTGLCYDDGDGVDQNYYEAVKWYKLAANQGHARAQNNLGLLYFNGFGVYQDYREASRCYLSAANQGCVNAMTNLGCCYAQGLGVDQSFEEAAFWSTLGCIGGDFKAGGTSSYLNNMLSAEQKTRIKKRIEDWISNMERRGII